MKTINVKWKYETHTKQQQQKHWNEMKWGDKKNEYNNGDRLVSTTFYLKFS